MQYILFSLQQRYTLFLNYPNYNYQKFDNHIYDKTKRGSIALSLSDELWSFHGRIWYGDMNYGLFYKI